MKKDRYTRSGFDKKKAWYTRNDYIEKKDWYTRNGFNEKKDQYTRNGLLRKNDRYTRSGFNKEKRIGRYSTVLMRKRIHTHATVLIRKRINTHATVLMSKKYRYTRNGFNKKNDWYTPLLPHFGSGRRGESSSRYEVNDVLNCRLMLRENLLDVKQGFYVLLQIRFECDREEGRVGGSHLPWAVEAFGAHVCGIYMSPRALRLPRPCWWV